MSTKDAGHSHEPPAENDALYRAAREYQDALAEWLITRDPVRRATLLVIQESVLARLYAALEGGLRSLVRRWDRSYQFQANIVAQPYEAAVNTLAMSLFGDIIAALPTCQLNPEKNVRGFLLRIARNAMYDQERLYIGGRLRRPMPAAPDSGDPAAAMWATPMSGTQGTWEHTGESHRLVETEDPASLDFTDEILSREMALRCWPVVTEFWHATLTGTDWQIMQLRWSSESPRSFAAIAARLGAGWTMDAVKMRHHRILRRTRAHLIERGLI